MPPTHRKLRRKDLKQPDEFLLFFTDLREFFTTNLRRIIVSAAVVAGVGVIVIATWYYERHRDHLVADQFYQAFQALDGKQYKVAEKDFSALAADEPSRELGRLARFYLATCYLAENDLPRARDTMVAYLAQAHDQAFETLALTDLAIVYERMGDLKKAEGSYRQAAAIEGEQGSSAELQIARIRARMGDRAGAVEAYQAFLSAHPFSAERSSVIEALAQLGAQPKAGFAAPGSSPAKLDRP